MNRAIKIQYQSKSIWYLARILTFPFQINNHTEKVYSKFNDCLHVCVVDPNYKDCMRLLCQLDQSCIIPEYL